MNPKANKHILPRYVLTELAEEHDVGARKVVLPDGNHYFVKEKLLPTESVRRDGKARWVPREFTAYPIVRRRDGTPWNEANAWILSKLENSPDFNIYTFGSHAEDLAAYLEFLEDRKIEWLVFPDHKHLRPTYRYRGYLKTEARLGTWQWTTAKRRMGTVIRFYRWLTTNNFIQLENEPWEDGETYINIKDRVGRASIKKVATTDLSINLPKSNNPYDPKIDDGGKLEPIPQKEQGWLMDALYACGNTEMTLIHLLSLWTGARIQTVLTLRVSHALKDIGRQSVLQLLCGPGTGIDTKYDKRMTIGIPFWLYQMLQTYAKSDRAKQRREKAVGGDVPDQYLFLSKNGSPMYEAKQDPGYSASKKKRHRKNGQAVRMYMTNFIIPYIKEKYDKDFKYQFHDLRATFGMNLVDSATELMNSGKTTYMQVLKMIQAKMCHESPITTEKYLQYRNRLALHRAVQAGWEEKLAEMAKRAMEGKGE